MSTFYHSSQYHPLPPTSASAAAAAAAAAAASQHGGGNHGHNHNHHHHSNHSGRSRRATRTSAHHQNQKQMRALRMQQKEAEEMALERAWSARREFEAARSFDFEDDEVFCPFNLLTDDDLQSMHSGSDRSSLSSGSPEHSPLQTQAHPTMSFLGNFPSLYSSSLASAPTPVHAAPIVPTPQHHQPKIHAPLAQRVGKAIPIVDPSTRVVASPPPSVSPARQLVAMGGSRRVW